MRLGIVPRRQRRTELKTTRYRFNALVVQDTTKKWSFNRVQRTGEGTVIDPPVPRHTEVKRLAQET